MPQNCFALRAVKICENGNLACLCAITLKINGALVGVMASIKNWEKKNNSQNRMVDCYCIIMCESETHRLRSSKRFSQKRKKERSWRNPTAINGFQLPQNSQHTQISRTYFFLGINADFLLFHRIMKKMENVKSWRYEAKKQGKIGADLLYIFSSGKSIENSSWRRRRMHVS